MKTLTKTSKGFYVTENSELIKQQIILEGGCCTGYTFMLADLDGSYRRGAFVLECGDIFDWVSF